MLQRLRTACDPERYQGDTLMMGGLFGICASIKLSTIIMTLVPGLILATGAVAVGVAVCLRGRQASAAPQPDKVQPMPELSNKQVGGLVAGALGVALLVRPQPQTALRYATYGGFLLSLAQFSDLRTQRLVGASLVVTGTALTAIACATSPAIGGSLIAAAAAIGGCYVATKLVDMALHLNLLGLRKQGFDTEWLDQLLNPTG